MPIDDELSQARAMALSAILSSTARLKLIVAGPGTGKTFTFQAMVEQTEGRSLIITFLTGLVKELETKFEADDSTDVYSFHGFAKKLLHQGGVQGVTPSVDYYPPLPQILLEDVRIIHGAMPTELVFGALFRNLAHSDGILQLALSRGEYYDSVSHDDAVYRVLRAMETGTLAIPTYAQIVVDEYQDFCPMEVAFIEVLSRGSPTMIVGDDDQALYSFRDATPTAIRQLASNTAYSRFELPYCTRCTEVLVKATHRVVEKAQAAGLLQGRLEKPYICYLPDKRAESEKYAKLRHLNCSTQSSRAPYMGQVIAELIARIPAEEIAESHQYGYPTVLVIGPKPFLGQVEDYLKTRFTQVTHRSSSDLNLEVLDAYRRLGNDENSNLGWRILVQFATPTGWEEAIRSTHESGTSLRELLDEEFVGRHLLIANIVRLIRAGEEVSAADRAEVAAALGVQEAELESLLLPESYEVSDTELDPTEPTIMLTSLMGSKGLQAGHVFTVGINEGHFPRSNAHPTNEEVCQLLVALTRARKCCTLVSTNHLGGVQLGRSVFVEWLRPLAVTKYIDRAFFRSSLGLQQMVWHSCSNENHPS